MLLAGLVVQGHPGGDDGTQPLDAERPGSARQAAARVLGGEDLLDHAQQVAAITVSHGQQDGTSLLGQGEATARQGLGARQQFAQGGLVQAAQNHDLAARQESTVQLETRILRGRPDQDNRPVLDVGQEGVLLGSIEPMDLIDEQQRPLPDLAAVGRGGEDLTQVGHPGEGRGDLLEEQARAIGQKTGDRRLAAARRPPQDDGGQATGSHHASQWRVGGEQLVLADYVVECPRAQPVGQRAPRIMDRTGTIGA